MSCRMLAKGLRTLKSAYLHYIGVCVNHPRVRLHVGYGLAKLEHEVLSQSDHSFVQSPQAVSMLDRMPRQLKHVHAGGVARTCSVTKGHGRSWAQRHIGE